MHTVKPAMTMAILLSSLVFNPAWARQAASAPPAVPEKPARETVAQASARTAAEAGAKKAPGAREQAPAAVKKQPPRRRAVQQIVDGMPAPSGAVVYGPRLTPPGQPATPSSTMASALPPGLQPSLQPSLPSTVPGAAPPPALINQCGPAGCTDTSGARYNGAGGALISPQGRLCSNNGVTVTCF